MAPDCEFLLFLNDAPVDAAGLAQLTRFLSDTPAVAAQLEGLSLINASLDNGLAHQAIALQHVHKLGSLILSRNPGISFSDAELQAHRDAAQRADGLYRGGPGLRGNDPGPVSESSYFRRLARCARVRPALRAGH
jgi:hypothetical protein